MPSRASKNRKPKPKGEGRDFMQVARRVVEDAIGERMDGSPLPEPQPDTRNQAAVTLSKLGAAKGGKARAESLSPAKRKAIAKKAAMARWSDSVRKKRQS
jgi:hypothetical protein